MDLKKELVAGRTLLVRYASRTRNSAQQREWRKLEVQQGPHVSARHKHGDIFRAYDLSDPRAPGRSKVFYVGRVIECEEPEPGPRKRRRTDK